MYQVITVLDGKESMLLDLRLKQYRLINPVLTLGINRTGSFTFSIHRTHPNIDQIDMLRSTLKIYRIHKNTFTHAWSRQWVYSGRPITSEEDFQRTGKVECEGILAYLLDSRVRPYTFAGAPGDYLDQLRQQHNSQVESGKQFKRGTIDLVAADNNNYITRRSSDYPNTLDEISNKITESLNVYIRARELESELYLDCTTSLPHNTQTIRYGKNLLNFTRKMDSTSLYTAVIPLGATIDQNGEDHDGNEENESSQDIAPDASETEEKRVTIKYYCPASKPEDWDQSYRDYCTRTGNETDGYTYTFLTGSVAPTWTADTYYYGLDYVYDRDLRTSYGVIMVPNTWDDVTLQSNLFQRGKQFLKSCLMTDSLTTKAADLSLTEDDVERFVLGWVTVDSNPHGLQNEMLLSEMQIPLMDPLNAEFTIGNTLEGITDKTNRTEQKFENKIQEIKSITRKAVENATNLITGAKGGYVILDKDNENGYFWRILVMDAPSTADAVNIIQINKNGIGFSTNGINGPYKNAWTIDGQLVAEFITAGNLIAGTVGGWSIGENLIRKEIDIDGYSYQVAMQAPDGNTTNCYYVRRRPIGSEDSWEYIFAIRYDGKITVTRGSVGGWTITDDTIQQQETLAVDGTDYVYHICLQSVSDEQETSNYIYVRRYQANQTPPTDATGWEYLAYLNKYGNFRCQQLRARKSLQCGRVTVTPSAADTPTAVKVQFDEPMWKTPMVVVSARTAVPGTTVTGVASQDESETGFTLYVTRKNTNATSVAWIAFAD